MVSLQDELMSFCDFGKKTNSFSKRFGDDDVSYYVNEFWTSRQRAAHSIHEVSYRACFKPQLPRFFIEPPQEEKSGSTETRCGRDHRKEISDTAFKL
jgi:hypothetical protein